eukprot:TRINITY_DN18526_c0_g2_i1.p1 TRINITY_DN18526_c0_g2~~TRINITY_DN18526_c0_g2_i1.p1  ORF type:complete len:598 (+),score=122.81 TRINITY_DN18526_c0_g2_i1:188-1981(+)
MTLVEVHDLRSRTELERLHCTRLGLGPCGFEEAGTQLSAVLRARRSPAVTPRPRPAPERSGACWLGERPPDLWQGLEERAAALDAFERAEVRRGEVLGAAAWSPLVYNGLRVTAAGACATPCTEGGEETLPLEEPWLAPRPPRGSAYLVPGRGGARQTLSELVGRDKPEPPFGDEGPTMDDVGGRRQRIEALEHGMARHEEERAARIGRGTAPLLSDGGPVLAVPLPERPHESRFSEEYCNRLTRKARKSAEASSQARAHGLRLMGADAYARFDEWPRPEDPEDRRRAGALAKTLRGVRRTEGSSVLAVKGNSSREHTEDQRGMSADMLLREAEALVLRGATEDEWRRLAAQLCARAYEAQPQEVLRMVRAVGAAACGAAVAMHCNGAGKKELQRTADHLVQSLTAHLPDADADILCEVLETMADARVGSQPFLDLVLSLLLARHHRDCQVLSAPLALRLASALGRVAETLRLRPKGTGGASTATNSRFMQVLERRMFDQIEEFSATDLARLDEYYLTRLCGEELRRASVEHMARLEIGLVGTSRALLPLVLRLQEALQREFGESYGWTFPRYAKQYLMRLRETACQERAHKMTASP